MKKFLINNWFRLTLLVLVVLSLILGFVLVASYISAKSYAEKLEHDRMYEARQKESCLTIYESEGDKWTNVTSWRYDSYVDECFIEYDEPKPKTTEECISLYKDSEGNIRGGLFREYLHCIDGSFEKSF